MKNNRFRNLRFDPLNFLLSARQPAWVKYQTYFRILDKEQDDPDVICWRKKRDESAVVTNIRAKQDKEGWFPCLPWMHIHKYYFHRLIEMGYGLEDDSVKKAAENLMDYQLPEGGYMHPTGPRVNMPNPQEGWAACATGYVTKALIDIGLRDHPKVIKTLDVLLNGQKYNGGWVCQRGGPCVDESSCIISGSPWSFSCLVEAHLINMDNPVAQKAIGMFARYKKDIIRHGYKKDRCYRCDETLLIPSLHGLGISKRDSLLRDLIGSLINKQQSDGSWHFRDRHSSWYTIEALIALKRAECI